MNKLSGRLLHCCFEQGLFAQKDLIQACLAWPNLARFWLRSENRASGLTKHKLSATCDILASWIQRTVTPDGHVKSTGINWFMFESSSAMETCLVLDLIELNTFVCTIELERKGWPEPENYKDLGASLAWMTQDPGCLIDFDTYFNGYRARCPKTRLSEFLTNPPCSDLLVHVLKAFQRTTLERYPLFDTLARIACENS